MDIMEQHKETIVACWKLKCWRLERRAVVELWDKYF
jgi:hypothetical protein